MVYAYMTMPDFVGLEVLNLVKVTNSEMTCDNT